MSTHHYLACDLGAESGRVILGTLENGLLTLEEIHRFPTGATVIDGVMRWDLERIFGEVREGIAKAGARALPIRAISTDSWGVDYVLMGPDGPLESPHHYRDARNHGGFERAFAVVPAAEIFSKTGIQFMEINTLYQLHDDVTRRPDLIARSTGLLLIADYFNYRFGGAAAAEESLASTTQIFNPVTRDWSRELLEKFGFPAALFPKIVPSGVALGSVDRILFPGECFAATKVVATCSHDTGAAVAAVPAEGTHWAYLSSGTWSLLGAEIPKPIITEASLAENFTNEQGLHGATRLLKNIVGLWIVQECKRAWAAAGNDYSYDELTRLAEAAAPFPALIHPGAPRFNTPGSMPEKIAAYCQETGQTPPFDPGSTIRCVLESLALLYADTLHRLESLVGHKMTRLHIVGGGSKNALLNQFAANATGLEVVAGPVEATAIGNILIQALALSDIDSHAALRRVVRDSFPVTIYTPEVDPRWSDAGQKLAALPKTD